MDDIVKAALQKWPNVPHCYGWLALDTRGHWYLRDDGSRATGPFPQVQGSRIVHEKLREFIQRNYGHDEQGAWFFRKGPQRVYVELQAAPGVWRVLPEPGWPVRTHTGRSAAAQAAWLDERGRLFLHTQLGLGLVHSMDMGEAAQAVEAGHWQPGEMPFAEMPARFGYQLTPRPPAV